MPRGTNLPRVAGYNEAVLLDAVRRADGGLSQVQLAAATGLAPQTVSNIVRRLLEQDFLRVAGVSGEGRGKPRTVLALNPRRRFAVGLHLDPSVVTAVVCDFQGGIVARLQDAEAVGGDAPSTVSALARAVERVVAESGIDRSSLAGVGVAVPGPVDTAAGAVFTPPWLRVLGDLRLADALAERVGLPVLLDKDTVAAAVGETWAAGDAGSQLLFVYLGTGIGSAVAVDGEVLRGASGNAGEIGHLVVDPGGVRCPCGRLGCLGRASDPAWLVADAAAAGVLAGVAAEPSPHEVDELVTRVAAAADAGDERATALLGRSARAVAEAVRVLVAVHDVQRVVLGGPFWGRFAARYRPVIEQALRDAPDGPRVAPSVAESAFGDGVGARGAATLVLDAAYSPRMNGLLVDRGVRSTD
jgi:predicted NBD/HSP70 family sugar kinase